MLEICMLCLFILIFACYNELFKVKRVTDVLLTYAVEGKHEIIDKLIKEHRK